MATSAPASPPVAERIAGRSRLGRLGGVVAALALFAVAAAVAALPLAAPPAAQAQDAAPPGGGSSIDLPAQPATAGGACLSCHKGIEDIHPWSTVSCVQCHGGNDEATTKETAHVKVTVRPAGDERVAGQSIDLDSIRFLDPGNLRAAHVSCGPCHTKAVSDTTHSLHATTSGHLGDGLYESGVVAEKHPPMSIFGVRDERPETARGKGGVGSLRQIGGFNSGGDPSKISTHFADLPRKACMQCHLWSRGRAVRGRAGMDGDYRGEGCSACHVPYADDGLSQSRDPTVDKFEPGHPKQHRMVRSPTTDTCTRCHYGDASIGLSFRGLAQPVPGMPQSPDAPGLHRKRLNGVYYIDDPSATPADVHHQRGMHCVDCHTRDDVMGDGTLYRRMEDAVEMRCETCHGTPDAYATGVTAKGAKLPHFVQNADGVFLRSRIDGTLRRMKQSRDIVRPGTRDYNPAAARAMNFDHGRLACHVCHSAWNPNFFGFHFDRNEAFTQLDLISGQRTAGRVTTQEKVFSTFAHFYVGWDSHSRLAPYMVGFSTMATVHAKDGSTILDQELPVTKAGLSGMTMIHHQTHSTSARARQCVECHRSPTALGRGSVNFRLGREFAAVAAESGVSLVALDRKTPANSTVISFLAVPGTKTAALLNDRLSGRALQVYAASAAEGLVAADVTSPAFPRITARLKGVAADPQALVVAASRLFLADGESGVKVFDISVPTQPKLKATIPVSAYALHLDGLNLFVAAGRKGLAVIDVRPGAEPRVLVETYDLNGPDTGPIDARSISVMFQFSRPHADLPEGPRSRARNIAAVGSTNWIYIVDVTEPGTPRTISGVPGVTVGDVALATIYELGSEGGAIPSRERDLLLMTQTQPNQALVLVDISEPVAPRFAGSAVIRQGARGMRIARLYNPPFVQTYAIVADAAGLQLVDVTRPSAPVVAASVAGVTLATEVDVEEFPLDRAVDADGKPILDVSHEGARWMSQEEFQRILGAPLMAPGHPGGPR